MPILRSDCLVSDAWRTSGISRLWTMTSSFSRPSAAIALSKAFTWMLFFPIAVAKSYGGGCNYTFTPV